jgi:hypothetical protein
MAATIHSKAALRCNHCGREVTETVHTRSSYRVDYYGLHTGEVEPVVVPRADETMPLVTVFKLLRPSEVVTCVACYQRPEVRAEREGLFRPEAAAPQEAAP